MHAQQVVKSMHTAGLVPAVAHEILQIYVCIDPSCWVCGFVRAQPAVNLRITAGLVVCVIHYLISTSRFVTFGVGCCGSGLRASTPCAWARTGRLCTLCTRYRTSCWVVTVGTGSDDDVSSQNTTGTPDHRVGMCICSKFEDSWFVNFVRHVVGIVWLGAARGTGDCCR